MVCFQEQLQNAQIEEAARALEKEGLAFAVGDGNHSLAAARRCWELSGEPLARWALVEIVNVYDEALVFEPIHRAIFGGDAASLRAALRARFPAGEGAALLCGGREEGFACGLAELQPLLDEWARQNGAAIDYIHGADNVRALARAGAVGVILPDFAKSDLFRGVVLGGVLPKKTFSMGHAEEKRYYLECRQIAPQTL